MNSKIDPFDAVRIQKKQTDASVAQGFHQKPEDQFESVRIKKQEGFPFLYETGRHLARTASRIGETILGIPGDISSLIQSGVFSGLEKLTGYPIPENAMEEVKHQRLPTTSELKQFSEKASSGFTSPQSKTEEAIDETVQTLASLLGPMKFRKALGVAIGSNLAKQGASVLGLKEGSQEAAKLGTMFALTMFNPGGATKYASSLFEKADTLSRGASITAVPFEGHLVNLVNSLKKGVSTASKNAVMKPAEELIGKIKNGKILVHDLTAAKRDLSTLMQDPALLKREKKLLKYIAKEVDQAIKPYEQINPSFSKVYRPANEIYSAVMEGNKARNFINKTLGGKSILSAIAGEALIGHPEYIPQTVGAILAVHGGARSLDFFKRIQKSPHLRRYYFESLKAAAKKDAPALRLYESKLKKEMNQKSSSLSQSTNQARNPRLPVSSLISE